MRAFMQSGVHRRVMARLPEWRDEAALVPRPSAKSRVPSLETGAGVFPSLKSGGSASGAS
jgi:hypothetical protein